MKPSIVSVSRVGRPAADGALRLRPGRDAWPAASARLRRASRRRAGAPAARRRAPADSRARGTSPSGSGSPSIAAATGANHECDRRPSARPFSSVISALAVLVIQSVEFSRIDQLARTGVGRFHRRGVERLAFGLNDDSLMQPIFHGELEIALIVRGHRHDRARAVIHEHEVGDVNRNDFIGSGMYEREFRYRRRACRSRRRRA